MEMNRRNFLKLSAAAVGKLIVGGGSDETLAAEIRATTRPAVPKRVLGKTGRKVSVIALGGIVVSGAEPSQAAKVVAESIQRGVNYFDVAPTYGDAEIKLGPALKPYRKKVFLACKTTQRKRVGAKEELDRSLKRLQTDHFDLYQLHGITDVEKDVKAALSKDGAIQTFLEARKQGIIRFIGFSAHSPQAALTAMREFDFDTIMYPVNFVCHYRANFDTEVLAEAKKRGLGIIAIKALAKCPWQDKSKRKVYGKCWYEPIDVPQCATRALSWSLAQGITVAIPPGEESLYRLALDVVPRCKPPDKQELAELKKIASALKPIFGA